MKSTEDKSASLNELTKSIEAKSLFFFKYLCHHFINLALQYLNFFGSIRAESS